MADFRYNFLKKKIHNLNLQKLTQQSIYSKKNIFLIHKMVVYFS
jgi:hypothetical protein